jgi:hypothetical protein
MGGGVIHLHQRHQPGGDPLIHDGKDAADDRLGGDDGGHDGQQQERDVEQRRLMIDHGKQDVLGLPGLRIKAPWPR